MTDNIAFELSKTFYDIQKNIHIFLISGKAEAGKDTAGKFLVEDLRFLNCKKLSFGSYVKDIAKQLGWDGNKDKRGRDLLQWLGDGVKLFNRNLWAEKACKDIIRYATEDGVKYFVFTDARYFDEVTYLKNRFANVHVLRVERPKHVSKLTEAQLNHPSETNLDSYPFEHVFRNGERKIETLERDVARYAEQFNF